MHTYKCTHTHSHTRTFTHSHVHTYAYTYIHTYQTHRLIHAYTENSHNNHVAHAVVLNLPVVPSEKFEKLQAVIKKIYGSIGSIREGERRI